MATVTALTAARMLEIEAESIVDGHVDVNGHLILERHDGVTIDAGYIVDNTNNVNRVGDQTVDGLKTFSQKVSVEIGAVGSAVRIGVPTALDALNISPYGAAAVVLASGAEYTGVGLGSTARAGSAGQLELLNGGLNFYANTGLVAGNAYTRTKMLGVGVDGMVSITRAAAGIGIYIAKEPGAFQDGSIVIGRTGGAQSISFQGAGAGAYSMGIGRLTGTDDISIARWGGSVLEELFRVTSGGKLKANGNEHFFGGNALGAAGAGVRLADDFTRATINALGSAANVQMDIYSKGTGIVTVSGASIALNNLANGKNFITVDTSGELVGGFSETALAIRHNDILKRVYVGAVDSGGAGYRYLRVPN